MVLREQSGSIPTDRKWIKKVKEGRPLQMGQHLLWRGPPGVREAAPYSPGEPTKNGSVRGVLLTGKT